MGVWANSQEESHRKMQELVEDAMPDGDTLVGAINAQQQSAFSVKFHVVGVTDQHLIVIPVDKRGGPPMPSRSCRCPMRSTSRTSSRR